jgi:hypothetical protein
MKAYNVVNLLAVVGCVTLTSNVYAQASSALPMASSPGAKRGTPNSFIRSALFAAIQGKDRKIGCS